MNNISGSIVVATIIVMASLLVFTSIGSSYDSDTAQFAKFTQDVDNVSTAVLNKYATLLARHAISGDTRTQEQIYIEIVTGEDAGKYAVMGTNKIIKGDSISGIPSTSTRCQNIDPNSNMLNITLPNVREKNDGWYVTNDGRIFNATGYVFDNKTYWNGYSHSEGELSEKYDISRVEAIKKAILEEDGYVVKTK